MFNPQRLGIARKRRMLNRKTLASRLGVHVNSITCWDQGIVPTGENVCAMARVLEFPEGFFYGPDLEEPTIETASFRSLSTMTAARREAAHAAGIIGFMVSDWIEERFELPSPNIPSCPSYGVGDPASIARGLRQEWALGEQPIWNMIHLLESKGVRIFSLAENTESVDAFSLWRNGRPFVFLNNFKSAERSRFDAAHELGHLVMHQDGRISGKLAEEQADCFASEFLMPSSDVLAVLPRVNYLQQLIKHKARWMVSLAALTYRVHKLGIITDWKNRDFCVTIAREGYRKHEPNSITREKSMVLEKVLRALWSEKLTQHDIARDLHLPESEVNDLLFGLLGVGCDDSASPRPKEPLMLLEKKGEENFEATA